MNAQLNRSILSIFFLIIAMVLSSAQIPANEETGTPVLSKISPDLQGIIDRPPDEIIFIIIYLDDQSLHEISRQKKKDYQGNIHEIKSNVGDYFSRARERAISKKKVKFDDEISVDIASFLTEKEKQDIFRENLRLEKIRQQMVHEIIIETNRNIQPQQKKMKAVVLEQGGFIRGQGTFYNVVFAGIPAGKIQEIETLPDVVYIDADGITQPQMDVSTASIYATAFWNNGYNGTMFEVGVADTGIDSGHPALSSRVIAEKDFVPGDSDGDNPDDLHGHGTHVAGTVASTDGTYPGVAFGAGLINLKIADSDIGYRAWDSDVMESVDWAVFSTGDPAEIISHSYGGNSGKSRFFDAVVDDLGLTVAVPAGNDGPASGTVAYDSYNAIVVGAMTDYNTPSRADDAVASYSSRGPVGTSRIKPDIMAPGTLINSARYDWETQADFWEMNGTSMATPHISGTAALLMSAGVFDPKEIKALLINTAEDRGAAGGDYDYGWGYVDMNHTFFHILDVRSGVVNNSHRYALYTGSALSGDKATLVWNRHVTYDGPNYPSQYYSLSDLDLWLYNESDGTVIDSSISGDENVEQVLSPDDSAVVLRVQVYNFASGISSEEFALATEEDYIETTFPDLGVNIFHPALVGENGQFNVTVNVTNRGDVSAHAVNVSLILPPGFSFVSGDMYADLGSIGATRVKNTTYAVRSSVGGSHLLGVWVNSSSYGETSSVFNTSQVQVDSIPPVMFGNPTGYSGIYGARNGSVITVNATIYDTYSQVENATVDASPVNGSLSAPIILVNTSGYWMNSSIMVSAPDGFHLLNVTSHDYFGNANTSACITVLVDSTPPQVVVNPTGYPAGFTAARNGTMIRVNASISDALSGVNNASVNVSQINDSVGEISLMNSSGFWTAPVTVNAPDGTYLLNVSSYDNALNYYNDTRVPVTIDNTPPSASASVEYQVGNSAKNGSTITLNVSASDNLAGILNVTANVSAVNISGTVPLNLQDNYWTGQVVVAAVDGNHSVRITVTDNASNQNITQVNVTMDNTAPSLDNVMASPDLVSRSGTTNISALVTGPDIDTVNADIFYPNGTVGTYPMTGGPVYHLNFTDTTARGRYNITITARDTRGNTNTSQTGFIVADIYTNSSVTVPEDGSLLINASEARMTLEIFGNATFSGSLDITRSIASLPGDPVRGPGIYIRINGSDAFSANDYANMSWALIRVYYAHEEISEYVESSLRLYWFNESTSTWVRLGTGTPSWVLGTGLDTDENVVWANVTHFSDYAIGGDLKGSSQSSSSGGGGGGGGGGTGEDNGNIECFELDRQFIDKGSFIMYTFSLDCNIVDTITFTGMATSGTVVGKVEMLRNTSTLVNVAPSDTVYRNLNIWLGYAGWAHEGNLKDVTITFGVDRAWIQANNIDPGRISLNRYADNRWIPLTTDLAGEQDDILTFTARIPPDGFGNFAVTGTAGPPALFPSTVPSQPPEMTESGIEPVPESSAGSVSTIVLVLGALVLLLTAGLIYGKKQQIIQWVGQRRS